jgi:hypothetical protein
MNPAGAAAVPLPAKPMSPVVVVGFSNPNPLRE